MCGGAGWTSSGLYGYGAAMRLNVFLQKSGIGSRREAERLVAEGLVTVNGQVAGVTTPVNDGDSVTVRGKPVSVSTAPVPRLFMLNKPLDVLVTTFDKQGRKKVFDLPVLQNKSLPRLMSVGRLDVNSEGLLLLSSDGPLAQAMMSPNTALERVYRVRVRGQLSPGEIAKLAKGVKADGVTYRGVKVSEDRKPTGANTWYTVTLTEGKNREIRKLMEYFGCIVSRLIRVSYGPFELRDLPAGALMEIPHNQVKKLIDDLKERGAKL